MSNQETISLKETLKSEVRKIINAEQIGRDEKLLKICELLSRKITVFNWVGFYLVDPDASRELVLGPFVGEPTEHTRIPFGKGICGQAAETNATFVVQDVNNATNYLACSVKVEAEIVVPVMKNEKFVAELDIDSHTKNSISADHQKLLESICEMVAEIF